MSRKKAESNINEFLRVLLWVIIFFILVGGVYFIFKFISKGAS
ncbi:MAG: hypothetical protein AABX30_03545 [Nanoarchaeota archaeon]